MKFSEIAEMYYEDNKGLMKPTSYSSSRWMYDHHIRDYWADRDVTEITSRETQKFFNYLAVKPMPSNPDKTFSEHVVKDIVGLFKTICYYAMREGVIPEFTFKLRKPIGIREKDKTRAAVMDENEYRKVLQLCTDFNFKENAHAKIFCLLGLTCGLRIGEVCGLRWEDIDFDRRTASVKRTVTRICDPDTGASYINIGKPKSKTSERNVYLIECAAETLNRYKVFKGVEDGTEYIIGGKTPSEPRTLRQAYQRFLKKHGINYLHPHGLRHTFCTVTIANGCDIKTVSSLLGHSDTAITLGTYTHITSKQIQNTIDSINTIFT